MKKIIIHIIFNNAGFLKNELTKEWIDYRMDIFMRYTFKSLINQTNQNFIVLISYRKDTKDIILSSLSKYPKLPSNIIFTDNVSKHIKENIVGYDKLYLSRIDSDDMYHPTFIQQIMDVEVDTNTKCIINQDGYIYDIETDKMAQWHHESPPFFTLIYNTDEYLKGMRYNLKSGHPGAIYLEHKILKCRNFIVIAHGKNTLTKFNSTFTKKMLDDDSKNMVLDEFNINKI